MFYAETIQVRWITKCQCHDFVNLSQKKHTIKKKKKTSPNVREVQRNAWECKCFLFAFFFPYECQESDFFFNKDDGILVLVGLKTVKNRGVSFLFG